MATTTTRPTTASAELRKLQETRDAAHAKAREARAERDGWNEETERLRHELAAHCDSHPEQFEGAEQRVKPDTKAAQLQQEIKARMAGDNPHEQAYGEALEHFHGFDRQVEQFKVERVRDRLAELDPDAEAAVAALREAHEAQLRACEQYRAVTIRFTRSSSTRRVWLGQRTRPATTRASVTGRSPPARHSTATCCAPP